jgi:uncharacterized DUF497 family protein
MEFEWDFVKSERNRDLRGFDFAFASQIFGSRCVDLPDARHDYGEQRILALGFALGVPLTVVFTDRVRLDGTVVRRIISARLSNKRERVRYGQETEVP